MELIIRKHRICALKCQVSRNIKLARSEAQCSEPTDSKQRKKIWAEDLRREKARTGRHSVIIHVIKANKKEWKWSFFLCWFFSAFLPYFFPWQTLQHFPGNWIGSSQSSFGHSFLIFRHWTRANSLRRFVT